MPAADTLEERQKARRPKLVKHLAYTICAVLGLGPFLATGGLFLYAYAYDTMDTMYAPGYSRRAFAQVEPGMGAAGVLSALGEPIQKPERSYESRLVHFGNGGKALVTRRGYVRLSEGIPKRLVRRHNDSRLSFEELAERCGGTAKTEQVHTATWHYAANIGGQAGGNGSHFAREVVVNTDTDKVIGKRSYWYWD